uniref:uncharacterized protein LOC120340810 n=1 Tax=Styela clava TaxID=7725 RepID=UPI0019395BFB|nr:uncharacterized protein LOC120340810 [Styela clava]
MMSRVITKILVTATCILVACDAEYMQTSSQCSVDLDFSTKPCFRLIDIGKFTCDFLYRCCWNPIENKCIQKEDFTHSSNHQFSRRIGNKVGVEPELEFKMEEYLTTETTTNVVPSGPFSTEYKKNEYGVHNTNQNQLTPTVTYDATTTKKSSHNERSIKQDILEGSGERSNTIEGKSPMLHENEDLELRSLVIDETSIFLTHIYEAELVDDFVEEYGSAMDNETGITEESFINQETQVTQNEEEIIDVDSLDEVSQPDADREQNMSNKERRLAERQRRREQRRIEREERRRNRIKKKGLSSTTRK